MQYNITVSKYQCMCAVVEFIYIVMNIITIFNKPITVIACFLNIFTDI